MIGVPRRTRQAPKVGAVSIPPPVGGWNTRDALDAMPPTDAVILDNWYPDLGKVSLRPGTASYATGLGAGPVQTVAEMYSGSTRKFLGACDGSVFDISGGGAVGAALATGFISSRWQTANFAGRLFMVNGSDTPQTYDGSTISASGWSGTGLTPENLVGVLPFKNRLFFWENASQAFWYPATAGAVTGVLTKFNLSQFTGTGGNVTAMVTLGYTTGNTPDDLCAVVLSSGDVLIFMGTDPGDPAAWALIGKYRIGAPVGIRAFAPYGGDCYLTTLTDNTSLNTWFASMRSGVPPPRTKISGAVLDATSAVASGTFGWQAIVYPKGAKIIFNVPTPTGSFQQHVLNTVTGAWCRYTGINAYCWGLYSDNLYFGAGGGEVMQAETGLADDSVTAIAADGQQAWQEFGSPNRKRVSAVRPIIQSGGSASYSFGVGYDFNTIDVDSASTSPAVGSPWDVSPWDVSPWGQTDVIDSTWRVAGGTGQSIATRIQVNSLQAISWIRTDFRMEKGSAL